MLDRKRTKVSSAPYADHDDCLAAAVDDFVRRRKVARWRVSVEWEDVNRERIVIFY